MSEQKLHVDESEDRDGVAGPSRRAQGPSCRLEVRWPRSHPFRAARRICDTAQLRLNVSRYLPLTGALLGRTVAFERVQRAIGHFGHPCSAHKEMCASRLARRSFTGRADECRLFLVSVAVAGGRRVAGCPACCSSPRELAPGESSVARRRRRARDGGTSQGHRVTYRLVLLLLV